VQFVVLGYAAYVLVVTFLFRGDAERRRALTYVGLGAFLLVVGVMAIMQGQLAVGLVGLALAGIELGLYALIRSTRPSP
jgi:type III secretory pathway component EscU